MAKANEPAMTRRRVVGGVGMGVAGIALSGTTAIAKGEEPMATQDLQDPTTKYPSPPYKKKSQPWPGSRARWTRRPIMARKAIAAPVG
jgi:hypothetical protein